MGYERSPNEAHGKRLPLSTGCAPASGLSLAASWRSAAHPGIDAHRRCGNSMLLNAKMRPMTSTERKTPQKVSLLTLVGIVVGSMVGGGVFTLPRSFGTTTGVLGAIIAWIIAGTGMLMLAFVFQSLALRRPDLDSGVYIYAKTGFGNYAGFNSAFGYWASNVAGNVFFLVFTMTTLGTFFPGLGEGNTFWPLYWPRRACGSSIT